MLLAEGIIPTGMMGCYRHENLYFTGITIVFVIHSVDLVQSFNLVRFHPRKELLYTVSRVNLDFGGASRQFLQARGECLVDFTLD